MKWWERKKRRGAAPVVQVRQGEGHPFGVLDRYTPLGTGEVALYRAIRRLDQREQLIISLRFGLGGRQEMTQKEVADLLGISQSYISRLEKRILARLRKELAG